MWVPFPVAPVASIDTFSWCSNRMVDAENSKSQSSPKSEYCDGTTSFGCDISYSDFVMIHRDATRDRFSVREFTSRYRLGQPVAVNFFQAKYDESVPALLKTFLN